MLQLTTVVNQLLMVSNAKLVESDYTVLIKNGETGFHLLYPDKEEYFCPIVNDELMDVMGTLMTMTIDEMKDESRAFEIAKADSQCAFIVKVYFEKPGSLVLSANFVLPEDLVLDNEINA